MDTTTREETGGVAVLRLARPPRNALDLPTLEGLIAALVAERPYGLPVVLTGDGTIFTAGIDVKAAATWSTAHRRAAIAGVNALVTALLALDAPLVVAIDGHAIGAGLVVAACSDRTIATTADCRLGLPEIAAGIPYPAGPLEAVRARFAPHVVNDLVLTGRSLTPAQALAAGVVDELAEPEDLVPRAAQVARDLAAHAAWGPVKEQLRRPVRAAVAAAVAADPLLA